MTTASSNFQLLTSPGGRPGDIGFKMTGKARVGAGLCRVWLRKVEPWERAIDPRRPDSNWDVRISIRQDSAFALQSEMRASDLPSLAEQFVFPQDPGGLADLCANGDPIHDAVVGWAHSTCVTRPPAAAPAPAPAGADDGWDEVEAIARQTGSSPTVS